MFCVFLKGLMIWLLKNQGHVNVLVTSEKKTLESGRE